MRRQPVAREHLLDRARAELLAIERLPRAEPARAADRVQSSEEPAEPLAILARAELGPAPAAPLGQREPIALVLVQRLARVLDRRHDRNLLRRELERELVLLLDRGVRPATRPIELRHDEPLGHTDLVHAVLVAREPEDAARALVAEGLGRADDDVGRQVLVRHLFLVRRFRTSAAAAFTCQRVIPRATTATDSTAFHWLRASNRCSMIGNGVLIQGAMQ